MTSGLGPCQVGASFFLKVRMWANWELNQGPRGELSWLRMLVGDPGSRHSVDFGLS